MSAKKHTHAQKKSGIHHSLSPPCLKHVDFSALPRDPAALPSPIPAVKEKKLIKWNKRPSTYSHRLLSWQFVRGTVSDSMPQPPPKVHLSVMYITVREGGKCACLCACVQEEESIYQREKWNYYCEVCVCIPLNAGTVYQC